MESLVTSLPLTCTRTLSPADIFAAIGLRSASGFPPPPTIATWKPLGANWFRSHPSVSRRADAVLTTGSEGATRRAKRATTSGQCTIAPEALGKRSHPAAGEER